MKYPTVRNIVLGLLFSCLTPILILNMDDIVYKYNDIFYKPPTPTLIMKEMGGDEEGVNSYYPDFREDDKNLCRKLQGDLYYSFITLADKKDIIKIDIDSFRKILDEQITKHEKIINDRFDTYIDDFYTMKVTCNYELNDNKNSNKTNVLLGTFCSLITTIFGGCIVKMFELFIINRKNK